MRKSTVSMPEAYGKNSIRTDDSNSIRKILLQKTGADFFGLTDYGTVGGEYLRYLGILCMTTIVHSPSTKHTFETSDFASIWQFDLSSIYGSGNFGPRYGFANFVEQTGNEMTSNSIFGATSPNADN